MMKRRVCSYDMFAVPDPSFVLKEGQLPSAEPNRIPLGGYWMNSM
jgi:hypothetical protein